jgi:hypothetical protein
MKTIFWIALLFSALLAGCGGGGGNPGTCIASELTCASVQPSSPGTPGTDVFQQKGTGDNSFTLPTTVTRVRIQASTGASAANFIVNIAGQPVVNQLLGTSTGSTSFDGSYLVPGGSTVEISNSAGVTWTVTELRTDTGSPDGIFIRTGAGDSVFDLPARVKRVHIQASTNADRATFMVRINGQLAASQVIGNLQVSNSYDATLSLAGGGTVEIFNSSGVTWTFTEIQ